MTGPGNIGELFADRYRIDGVLGKGGFGVVYAAYDTTDRLDVAVKVLRLGRSSEDEMARRRFEREVEVVARLKSPHTVRLLGHGADPDGVPYAVFEKIRGVDLVELLVARQRLDPAEVVHILRQLLSALAEAHANGLLHRDLKPENVRIDEDAPEALTVKLLDFGIARVKDGGPALTRTGELIGTPRYMSPEQLTEKELSPASDLYSLGIVAYELLVGRDGLAGGGWGDQLERLQSGYVFSMPEVDRIGRPLLEIVQRMTARRPADRFRSAPAVLRGLDAIDREPSAPKRDADTHDAVLDRAVTRRVRKRGPAVVMAIAVILLLVVGIIVVAPDGQDDDDPRTRDLSHVLHTSEPKVVIRDTGLPVAADQSRDAAGDTRAEPDVGSGCGLPAPFIGRHPVAGNGSYAYVPADYAPDQRTPLVIVLHQMGESALELLRVSGFEALADEHGFIVVAPQYPRGLLMGYEESWRSEDTDLPSIRQIIGLMSDNLCIDEDRVFVVTNGHAGRVGMIASCEPWIAATAIHSFGNAGSGGDCFKAAPAPHLLFTPMDSPHVPFDGGESCSPRIGADSSNKLSAEELEALWKKRNRCRGKPEIVYEHDGSRCFRWRCDAPFQSCHVAGGNGWPGSELRVIADQGSCAGPPPTEVDIASITWDFFEHAEALSAKRDGE